MGLIYPNAHCVYYIKRCVHGLKTWHPREGSTNGRFGRTK